MTTHQQSGPERRYVQLHRAIEQGHASDEVWEELSTVCYRLGYMVEAVKCAGSISDSATRRRAELRLAQRGVLDQPNTAEKSPANWRPRPSSAHNEAVPSETGARSKPSQTWSYREELIDSFGYLSLEHLPATVIAVTLTFPLVVGLGGMLTAGSDAWVLPAIALLPVLCIATLVASLAREILVESSRGFTDPPRISDLPRLARNALRFCKAGGLASLVLILPGVLAGYLFGATVALPMLICGGALLPIAVSLCLTRDDLRGVHPSILVPTVLGLGSPGAFVCGIAMLLFGPAVLALLFSEGSALFLRMSIIGPLAITPVIVTARLIGRVFCHHRNVVGSLVWNEEPTTYREAVDHAIRTYDSRVVESQRIEAVVAKLKQAPAAEEAEAPRKPVTSTARRQPRPEVQVIDEEALDTTPAPVAIEDLPGFRVLKGAARVKAGAAAAKPEA